MALSKTAQILGLTLALGCKPNADCEERTPVEDESSPALCVARGVGKAWLENLPGEGVPLYTEDKADYAGAYSEEEVVDASLCRLDPEGSARDIVHDWMKEDLEIPGASAAVANYYDENTISEAIILFEGGHYNHSYEGDDEDRAEIEADCGYTEQDIPKYKLPRIPQKDWPNQFRKSLTSGDESTSSCHNIYEGIETILNNHDYNRSLSSAVNREIADKYWETHPGFDGAMASQNGPEFYGDTMCLTLQAL